MARYRVTQNADGDFVFFHEGQRYRIVARAEKPGQFPVVAIEGAISRSPITNALRMQVAFCVYLHDDGAEKSGGYLGKLCDLVEA